MDALKRINGLCLTLTVFIFAVATPFIEQISHFPWIPQTFTKSLAAFIASVGGYSLVVNTLPGLADSWKPLKKFFIGPSYVEGTWVGFYITKENEVRYIVEVFEQNNFNVNLRGVSYDEQGNFSDKWTAPIVTIDQPTGMLKYMYESVPEGESSSVHYGIANYQFVRQSLSTPPNGFEGTVIDSGRAATNHTTLTKVSDSQIELLDGLKKAKDVYDQSLLKR
jgi:hypothetical protein